MVLEKILESPLDSMEIKSVNPKGNQPWIFIGSVRGVWFPQFCLVPPKIQSNGPALQPSGRPVLQLSDGPGLQLCVTIQFYLENKGEYILKAWGHDDPKDVKRRERPRPFGSSFYMFFLLRLGLPFVNWTSQECCLFYLRPSLRSSDLPLFYFYGLLPSLSFSHRHSGLPFPILTTLQKDLYWSWSSNTLATWCEELTQWEKTLMLGNSEGKRRRGSGGWGG